LNQDINKHFINSKSNCRVGYYRKFKSDSITHRYPTKKQVLQELRTNGKCLGVLIQQQLSYWYLVKLRYQRCVFSSFWCLEAEKLGSSHQIDDYNISIWKDLPGRVSTHDRWPDMHKYQWEANKPGWQNKLLEIGFLNRSCFSCLTFFSLVLCLSKPMTTLPLPFSDDQLFCVLPPIFNYFAQNLFFFKLIINEAN
jgi:hypothetical protein